MRINYPEQSPLQNYYFDKCIIDERSPFSNLSILARFPKVRFNPSQKSIDSILSYLKKSTEK